MHCAVNSLPRPMRTSDQISVEPGERRRLKLLVVVITSAIVLGACDSDSDDVVPTTQASTTSTTEAVTTTTEATGAEAADPTDLYGTWSSGGQTWDISEGSIAVTGGVVDGFTYTVVNGNRIRLADQEGPRACPPSQFGAYDWAIDGDVLSLTVFTDRCEGRRNFLDGFTLQRTE